MQDEERMDEQLWQLIDGDGTETQRRAIEIKLKADTSWQHRYQELLQLQQELQDLELMQPSMRFTQNVMDQIAQLPVPFASRNYINKWVLRTLAGAFATLLIVVLAYSAIVLLAAPSAATSYPGIRPLPSFTLPSGVVQCLIGANILIGLVVLDKILRSKRRVAL